MSSETPASTPPKASLPTPALGPVRPSSSLPPAKNSPLLHKLGILCFTLFIVYLLILSVGMIGSGFKWAAGGEQGAQDLFRFATNPFMGLVLGIFTTALIQSSSTVTSVIVGLVAGGLPVQLAIPMIMGANIGTTVTGTLVSLGHITKPAEFQRAFAAATVHDIFNFLAVAIFLSLEIATQYLSSSGQGLLEQSSGYIASIFAGSADVDVKSFDVIKPITKPVIGLFHSSHGNGIFDSFGPIAGGICMAIVALVFIFGSILLLGKVLKKNLTGKAEKVFHAAVGRGPISGICSGAIITMLVQSSSTTTSLIVPMAGSGVMKLKQIFPFSLGANIGTTITALIASLAGGAHAEAALQIALVHTLFNVFGTILIYGIPFLRAVPLNGAEWVARLAIRNRALAIIYIVALYFIIPLLLLILVHGFSAPAQEQTQEQKQAGALQNTTPIIAPTTPKNTETNDSTAPDPADQNAPTNPTDTNAIPQSLRHSYGSPKC